MASDWNSYIPRACIIFLKDTGTRGQLYCVHVHLVYLEHLTDKNFVLIYWHSRYYHYVCEDFLCDNGTLHPQHMTQVSVLVLASLFSLSVFQHHVVCSTDAMCNLLGFGKFLINPELTVLSNLLSISLCSCKKQFYILFKLVISRLVQIDGCVQLLKERHCPS